METFTTKKNAAGKCQILKISSTGQESVVCEEGQEVTYKGKKYTTVKRTSDNKCCIFRLVPDGGGQNHPELVLVEGNTIQL